MSNLTRAKLEQAAGLVAESGADVWLTFVRETAEAGDPVLPLILEGGLTWQSALIVAPNGKRIAVVGRFDADMLAASGDWDDVIPYDQSIREPLLQAIESVVGSRTAKIAVNYSTDDVKADGLSHGMFLLLQDYLKVTSFSLVSAETIVSNLRAIKTADEIARIKEAIRETNELFDLVDKNVCAGQTEREAYALIQEWIDSRGLGYAWDRSQCPIVNSGPDSMVGHGIPSSTIQISPGHIFHIDVGVQKDGYCSDIQSCWYVPHSGEDQTPDDVIRALKAVTRSITAASEVLKPGVEGWHVDAAARSHLVSLGYEEYMHATGHQVGRVAHDGGAVLGPRWERYGRTPFMRVQSNEVYTLELGVMVEGRGYLGIEEMVLVTDSACEWLTERQLDMPLLSR